MTSALPTESHEPSGASTGAATAATFEPPGPGLWERDLSHVTAAPTRVFRRVTTTTMPSAYREVFADFGGPVDTLDIRFVGGAMYNRIVPLIGADSDRPPPPKPLMWLALRLHPLFRAREKAARRLWSTRPDRDTVEHWYRSERAEWVAKNLAIQAVDVGSLDDAELASHVRIADAHMLAGWRRHHVLHGADIGPLGDLLVHAHGWGLTTVEVLALLRGSSPATSSAAAHGRRIADALRGAGVDPAGVLDLDDVRAVPAAAVKLEAYLEEARWRIATSYDIEGLTVGELPGATCALIRSSHVADDDQASLDELENRLRQQVPDADRPLFDELLGHARTAYGMRDDNGPITAAWPTGLLRRAFLEAGSRLHTRGALHDPAHVFELDSEEVAAALEGAAHPDADEATARAAERAAEATLDPPAQLGPRHDDPDLSVFPPGMKRTMNLIITAISLMEADPTETRAPLQGTGIGDASHRGTARVVDDPARIDELFASMEPGDVLVAPWTAPSFNALFAIAGGVVVREGGPLCHAAVMARELGIPTVIGCAGAMDHIHDGDLVEVDPAAGEVRVLSPD
jgi:rifampicin phosphotransferase